MKDLYLDIAVKKCNPTNLAEIFILNPQYIVHMLIPFIYLFITVTIYIFFYYNFDEYIIDTNSVFKNK